MERRIINPWTWQDQWGFVQANEMTGMQRVLLCAGQTSVDDDGNVLHVGDMAGQLNKALDNLETVLGQAGLGLSDVMRLNYYVTDISAYTEAAPIVLSRLGKAGCRPAATLLGVAALAFPELLVEIEATAVK
ncbi:MAG: RidA family protein [Chloroflexi bacterium]|nr:RidA family protein [Chloroflexota bacterium]